MRKKLVEVNKFLHRLGCELTRQPHQPFSSDLLEKAHEIDTDQFRELLDSWYDEREFREINRAGHQFKYEYEITEVIEMYQKIMPVLLARLHATNAPVLEDYVSILKEMFGDEPLDFDEIACSQCKHSKDCDYAL